MVLNAIAVQRPSNMVSRLVKCRRDIPATSFLVLAALQAYVVLRRYREGHRAHIVVHDRRRLDLVPFARSTNLCAARLDPY